MFVPVVPMASDGGGFEGSSPVFISFSVRSAQREAPLFLRRSEEHSSSVLWSRKLFSVMFPADKVKSKGGAVHHAGP